MNIREPCDEGVILFRKSDVFERPRIVTRYWFSVNRND